MTNVAALGRWVLAAGIASGGVYLVYQWDAGAAWFLAVTILLGTLIARPGDLANFTATITGILAPAKGTIDGRR